jgi:hypothetical protein
VVAFIFQLTNDYDWEDYFRVAELSESVWISE